MSRDASVAAAPVAFDPGSFRDRTGRVFLSGGAVYRGINAEAKDHWDILRQKAFFQRLTAAGKVVATEQVEPESVLGPLVEVPWAAVLKHERIPFVSYAYEWSFAMLRDAALSQLELIQVALADGMILKDASPYNLQWRGTQPVFIDIPSFVAYEPGNPWVGYRQFCQLFLYPLFLRAYKNAPFIPWLRGAINGIDADHCRSLMSWRDLLRPGVFAHVFLHAQLQASQGNTNKDVGKDIKRAGFGKQLIESNVAGLHKTVTKLRWRQRGSEWANYAQDNSYTAADRALKEEFVRTAAAAKRRRLVWDLGANTGHFSRIAAEHADYVIAFDKDELAIERLYGRLKEENNKTILPLVMDLADPSVNRGWRGLERQAIAKRGRPDFTLCLALMHHLAISAHIPLTDFVQWMAGLGGDAVFEFVTRDDPMVRRMLRFRNERFDDYNLPLFERCLQEWFHVIRREPSSTGTRVLFHVSARDVQPPSHAPSAG